MRKYSKTIIENGKFIFEYDDKRIEFSSPSIQPFDEDNKIISSKDIMYYYYTMTLYDAVIDFNEDNGKDFVSNWNKVAEVDAYDVPAIQSLQKYLKKILKFNVKKHGFNIKYKNEMQEWKYTWNIDGWMFKEDEYIITKTKRKVWQLTKYNEPYWYDIYVGCGGYTKHNTIGINLVMLNQKDLKNLKYVVDKFIKYSLDCYNKN
jgi:hypothetical protein